MQKWVWKHALGVDSIPRSSWDEPQDDHPTTTRAMISDPKLPFASEPAAIENPAESRRDAVSSVEAGSDRGAFTGRRHSTARLWLRRIGVLLFVFFCATLGVMLMIVPWRPEWSDNPLLLSYPVIREAVSSGFVRGLVTGLGLLNVWMGFWEAVRYREDD